MDDNAAEAGTPAAENASAVEISTAETRPISKNQQKKMAKAERKQEMHRQKKEAKKKEKQQKQAEKRAREGAERVQLSEEERAAKRAAMEKRAKQRHEEREAVADRLLEARITAPKLVLDLDFWDLMPDGSQRSLVSQLAFSSGCNKKSEKPCSLHFTSFGGGVADATARQFPGHVSWAVTLHSEHWSVALSKHRESLVYLTADAEEEIETLDPKCFYIIGGLVDRNKLKRICFNRAEEHGIRTARLPIASCLQLAGSKGAVTESQV